MLDFSLGKKRTADVVESVNGVPDQWPTEPRPNSGHVTHAASILI
jgi:hypothetical protein